MLRVVYVALHFLIHVAKRCKVALCVLQNTNHEKWKGACKRASPWDSTQSDQEKEPESSKVVVGTLRLARCCRQLFPCGNVCAKTKPFYLFLSVCLVPSIALLFCLLLCLISNSVSALQSLILFSPWFSVSTESTSLLLASSSAFLQSALFQTHARNDLVHFLGDGRVDILRSVTARRGYDVDVARALHVTTERCVMLHREWTDRVAVGFRTLNLYSNRHATKNSTSVQLLRPSSKASIITRGKHNPLLCVMVSGLRTRRRLSNLSSCKSLITVLQWRNRLNKQTACRCSSMGD